MITAAIIAVVIIGAGAVYYRIESRSGEYAPRVLALGWLVADIIMLIPLGIAAWRYGDGLNSFGYWLLHPLAAS